MQTVFRVFFVGRRKTANLSQSLAVSSFNHSCVRIYFASFSWSTRAFSLVADLQNGGENNDLQTSIRERPLSVIAAKNEETDMVATPSIREGAVPAAKIIL